MTSMRVTMVNKYYPPHVGGIEYHMRDLATGLVARGIPVRAIVANESRTTCAETIDGVDVIRLRRAFAYASTPVACGMPSRLTAEMEGRLQTGARDGAREGDAPPERPAAPPDIIHLHFPYPWGEISWLRARARAHKRPPTVLTYHSDIVRQRTLGTLYAPILRKVLDEVDLIIATSPNMVEHSPFLAPLAAKCRIVPFGIPLEQFCATPGRTERAIELRALHQERPIVLFVGRLVYYKGIDILVRAMAHVNADLVIAGQGPLQQEIEALAESSGIAKRVFFEPWLTPEELAAWYQAADVLCLPSVARSEAFGLVQLEAHAAGTPVVSTALTTGVPFVNEDGVTGLVVPPSDVAALADALRALVANSSLRARLGEQARARAFEQFSLDKMITRTIATYDEARGVH